MGTGLPFRGGLRDSEASAFGPGRSERRGEPRVEGKKPSPDFFKFDGENVDIGMPIAIIFAD